MDRERRPFCKHTGLGGRVCSRTAAAARSRPENTLAAFEIGLAVGADGLELDVHLSADGVPVVVHDPTLDRTTNATGPLGREIGRRAGPGGRRLPVPRTAPRAAPFRPTGLGVPALADVLRRYRGVPIIIELKVDSGGLWHPRGARPFAQPVPPIACALAGYGFVVRAPHGWRLPSAW